MKAATCPTFCALAEALLPGPLSFLVPAPRLLDLVDRLVALAIFLLLFAIDV